MLCHHRVVLLSTFLNDFNTIYVFKKVCPIVLLIIEKAFFLIKTDIKQKEKGEHTVTKPYIEAQCVIKT